jgi:hypothetical protein
MVSAAAWLAIHQSLADTHPSNEAEFDLAWDL